MQKVGKEDAVTSKAAREAAEKLVPVPRRPGQLPNKVEHLDNLFDMVAANWKTYMGEKPTGDKLVLITAVYRQAVRGDCKVPEGEWSTLFEKRLLEKWRSYKGHDPSTMKRRFLKLLREVNPRLLICRPYTMVPWGFPKVKGRRGFPDDLICPYANSSKGCPRPLLDRFGRDLETELNDSPDIADFVKLKEWMDHVVAHQRCSLGLHIPITSEQAKKFVSFYARPECGGFKAYDPSSRGVNRVFKKALTKQFLHLVDLQTRRSLAPSKVHRDTVREQKEKVMSMQLYYGALTGEDFKHEAPCTRNNQHCNERRIAEAGNHMHPVVIDKPEIALSDFDGARDLREECERLGVLPSTGAVRGLKDRTLQLQLKVADFHRRRMLEYEAIRRQKWREERLPSQLRALSSFSASQLDEQLHGYIDDKNLDLVCRVVERGAPPDSESPRTGVFPLLLAVLERSKRHVRRLLKERCAGQEEGGGVDINHANKFGMSALMWAVKRNDFVMAQLLLDKGAAVDKEGSTGWTAVSVAARSMRTDMIDAICDAVLKRDKLRGPMFLDKVLNHRSNIRGGLTALMTAARARGEGMVRHLLRLGAKPGVKDHQGDTASDHALQSGWLDLGNWLRTTRAVGKEGIYTYDDVQGERHLAQQGSNFDKAVKTGEAGQDPGGVSRAAEIVREGKVCPDQETSTGHTALLTSVFQGCLSTVLSLIEEGADVSYANRNGRTPLMAAAVAGHEGMVLELLEAGAEAKTVDIDGRTASSYAEDNGHSAISAILAVAALHGNHAALLHAEEKEKQQDGEEEKEARDRAIERMTGVSLDVPEEMLTAWMRGLRASDLASASMGSSWEVGSSLTGRFFSHSLEMREAAALEQGASSSEWVAGGMSSGAAVGDTVGAGNNPAAAELLLAKMQRDKGGKPRCPKCTLYIPCQHYANAEHLLAEDPGGSQHWQWQRRPVSNRARSRRGEEDSSSAGDGDGMSSSCDSASVGGGRAPHGHHHHQQQPQQQQEDVEGATSHELYRRYRNNVEFRHRPLPAAKEKEGWSERDGIE